MTISEVSKIYDLSADTLRYYEKIGLLDDVQRNASGVRNYQESDLRRIEFIRHMRNAGLSIEVLIRYIELFHQGNHTIPERKQILQEQRNLLNLKIKEMQETLDRLDCKIENYDMILLKHEQELQAIQDEAE